MLMGCCRSWSVIRSGCLAPYRSLRHAPHGQRRDRPRQIVRDDPSPCRAVLGTYPFLGQEPSFGLAKHRSQQSSAGDQERCEKDIIVTVITVTDTAQTFAYISAAMVSTARKATPRSASASLYCMTLDFSSNATPTPTEIGA